MSVEIVTGLIGSGKTRYCLDGIRASRNINPSVKCVLIVPLNYSHETEKMIIEEFGGTGLNGIEVTSFEKLARNLMKGTQKHLSAPGKQALVCRAVEMCLEETDNIHDRFDGKLLAAMKKPGFIDVASSIISELRRSGASERLKECSNEFEDGTLKQKSSLMLMVADNYNKLINDTEYIDSDEDLTRLAAAIGDIYKTKTRVWIDGFDEFLKQEFEVICSLMDAAEDVTMTFTVCSDDDDTYSGTLSTIAKIREYSPQAVLKRLQGGFRHLDKSPDLRFLFSTWNDRSEYKDVVRNAEIFEAMDAYTEIEYTACRIIDMVREEHYRFRDIAVICGNRDSYSHIIKAVFDEYEIPYYSDEKVSIAKHPIAMQVLSLFDIEENDWDYASMFEYLRAGFIYRKVNDERRIRYRRFNAEKIDMLENYVLKYGIRGKSRWSKPWDGGQKRILDEAFGTDTAEGGKEDKIVEEMRKTVTEPLLEYSEAVKDAVTVADYCRAVYGFLESINLYAGLKSELLAMALQSATADAQRFGQIWNLILSVLDQLYTALGDTKVSSSEFYSYMRAAMEKCEIRTIPSGIDRVYIGSAENSMTANVKVLFAAGAVTGTFPSEPSNEGFFSDSEKEYLESFEVKLSPVSAKRKEKQYSRVYKAVSGVTDKLFISYTTQTPEGKACRASQMVLDIKRKLRGIKFYSESSLKEEELRRMYISSPAATLHKMLINNEEHPLWKYVREWFEKNDKWRGRILDIAGTKDNFQNREIYISPKTAQRLYRGLIMYSPTRLDMYASCPFGYFMKYGLGARQRDEWQLSAADTGTYAHELIKLLFEHIGGERDWMDITDEECEIILDEIIKENSKRITDSDMNDKERCANILRRTGETVKAAAKAVRRSLIAGGFRTKECEMGFETRLSDNVGIKGIIDRVDICSHDGINEYRIIDYKTGKKEFKLSEIYNGLSMQPIIYAVAICMADEKGELSGTYYSRVRNDFAKLTIKNRADKIKKDLNANTALSGVTFVDMDKTGTPDKKELDMVEAEDKRSGIFFALNKNGDIDAAKSNLHSRRAAKNLIRFTADKILDTDSRIREGDIRISPVSKGFNSSVCDYCDYAAACRFDEQLREIRQLSENDKELWEIFEEDESDEVDR